MDNKIIKLTDKILELENKLADYKKIETEQKELKEKLLEAMIKGDIKKWTTNNGVQITVVEGKEPSEEKQMIFNEEKFLLENPDIYNKYQEEQIIKKSGRKPYLKITL